MKPRHTPRQVKLDRIMASGTALTAVTGVGTVLTTTPEASAAVVYSGVVNINVPATFEGVYLNVLSGTSSSVPASVPGWDLNPWGDTNFGLFSQSSPANSHGFLNVAGTHIHTTGVTVGATSAFTSNPTSLSPQVTLNSDNNYAGFRFFNENTSQIHYGWVRFEFGAAITTRSIKDYAYESTAGASILTGAGIVPETSTLSLLALGAAGLMRRRRAA